MENAAESTQQDATTFYEKLAENAGTVEVEATFVSKTGQHGEPQSGLAKEPVDLPLDALN